MADNFDFKKFLVENRVGPYAGVSEASAEKEVRAQVNTDTYGNLDGLYLYTYINGIESEYELRASEDNDNVWDVQGGTKVVDNKEIPVSDQEVSALLNDEDIWNAVDKAFNKYERPSADADDNFDGPEDGNDDDYSYRDIHGPTHRF